MKKLIATILMLSMILTVSIPSYAGQWQYNDNGWWYLNDDNTYPANGWLQLDGSWYCFDSTGYLRTGWIQSQNGSWYYSDPSTGAMLTNTWTPDGYYVNANGISSEYASANPQRGQQSYTTTTQSSTLTYSVGSEILEMATNLFETFRSIRFSDSNEERQFRLIQSQDGKVQLVASYCDQLLAKMQPYPELNEASSLLSQFKASLPAKIQSESDIVSWLRQLQTATSNYETFSNKLLEILKAFAGI